MFLHWRPSARRSAGVAADEPGRSISSTTYADPDPLSRATSPAATARPRDRTVSSSASSVSTPRPITTPSPKKAAADACRPPLPTRACSCRKPRASCRTAAVRDSPPTRREFAVLRDWIAAGAPFGDPNAPHVVDSPDRPASRCSTPGRSNRSRVTARYTDGREVDVTALAKFQSNNDGDRDGRRVGPGADRRRARSGGRHGELRRRGRRVLRARAARDEAERRRRPPAEANFIDRLVNAKLARLNIAPSPRCDDAEFLRRVTLDLIGTLADGRRGPAFLADKSTDKRARWVDALLDRPEFADYWALKWSDLLRVDRQTLGHKAGPRLLRMDSRELRDEQAVRRSSPASAHGRRPAGRTARRGVLSRGARSRATRRAPSRRSSSACASRAPSVIIIRTIAGARPTTTA